MSQQWKQSEIGYTGISFPFRLEPSGMVSVSTVSVEDGIIDHIVEAIVQIVRTVRGERFFRRNWGAQPVHIVFRPNTETEMLWFASEIKDLFSEYEPRVRLVEFDVIGIDPEQGYVKLRMGFEHTETQISTYIEVAI